MDHEPVISWGTTSPAKYTDNFPTDSDTKDSYFPVSPLSFVTSLRMDLKASCKYSRASLVRSCPFQCKTAIKYFVFLLHLFESVLNSFGPSLCFFGLDLKIPFPFFSFYRIIHELLYRRLNFSLFFEGFVSSI